MDTAIMYYTELQFSEEDVCMLTLTPTMQSGQERATEEKPN